jgi:hypothetical protein
LRVHDLALSLTLTAVPAYSIKQNGRLAIQSTLKQIAVIERPALVNRPGRKLAVWLMKTARFCVMLIFVNQGASALTKGFSNE